MLTQLTKQNRYTVYYSILAQQKRARAHAAYKDYREREAVAAVPVALEVAHRALGNARPHQLHLAARQRREALRVVAHVAFE